jgi:aryl-alcohol dehydrogenase-like predicted oxidoreductase
MVAQVLNEYGISGGTMLFTRLGDSDLEASRIGFGCWAMGGTDWGPVDDNDSINAIAKALDCGINVFDTADVYGDGHSEEILGTALGNERKNVIVATKVGGVKQKGGASRHDTSRKHILGAIEASLRRLKTDYVDLYQIHVPDASTPVSETVSALLQLKKQGKIRYFGLSNVKVEEIKEYMKYGPVTTLQPEYSMIQRQSESELFPFCLENKIAVLAYSPLGRGLLTGKYSRKSSFIPADVRAIDTAFQGKVFEINLDCVERLRPIAADSGRSLTQLAIAWAFSNPAVSVALVGAKTSSQVEENASAYDSPLSSEALAKIEGILEDTEAEKTAFKERQMAKLRGTPITEIKSDEEGKELIESLIIWMLHLHENYSVSAKELGPIFSGAALLKMKGTIGQAASVEELRLKLQEIDSRVVLETD